MSERSESSLWRLFPTVRSSERGRFLFFFAISALISAGQTIGLTGTEALYLVRIGPANLPVAFTLASLVTVAGSLVYAYWVGRLHNDRFFVFLLGGSALVLGGASLFVRQDLPWLVTALFCGFYLLQAVFVNLHFWTFAADFFDTLASKRLFPLFALGASVGGVIGGLFAALLSRWLGVEALIVAWTVPLLVAKDEADIKTGLISCSSPIARALIGKNEGDLINFSAPGGEKHYEVIEVRSE